MLSFQFPGFHNIFTLMSCYLRIFQVGEKIISNVIKEQEHNLFLANKKP